MAGFGGSVAHGAQWVADDVEASADSTELVAAVTGQRVRVLGAGISCGGTASTVQFEADGTGISAIFNNSIVLPPIPPGSGFGWFETGAGEALDVSTGSGSTTGIQVIYEMVG